MVCTNSIKFLVLIFISQTLARHVVYHGNDGTFSEFHEEHGPGSNSFQSVSSRMGPGMNSYTSSSNFVSSGDAAAPLVASRMMGMHNMMMSHRMNNPAFRMLQGMAAGMGMFG